MLSIPGTNTQLTVPPVAVGHGVAADRGLPRFDLTESEPMELGRGLYGPLERFEGYVADSAWLTVRRVGDRSQPSGRLTGVVTHGAGADTGTVGKDRDALAFAEPDDPVGTGRGQVTGPALQVETDTPCRRVWTPLVDHRAAKCR